MQPKSGMAFRRLLVVRTDRLGDVVLSLPVISALRRTFPGAHVAVLVHPSVVELVEDHPDLDAVLIDGGECSWMEWMRLVRKLRKERFDAALLLHPTLRLAAALAAARIRIRVGTGYRFYSFLFNRRVFEHRKRSIKHEAEYNLSLARILGADISRVVFRLNIAGSARKTVDAFLRERLKRRSRPLVVLHPGSRKSALDWPIDAFTRLADKLVREAHASIVVSGGPQERDMAERMAAAISTKAISAAGRFNLKELRALFQRADLFISNSTGPLHLARAAGTEVIGLYPPLRPASHRRWGPYGRNDSVLVPDLPECRRCRGRRCPEWNCMRRISVDAVFALSIQKLAGKKKSSSGSSIPDSESRTARGKSIG